MNAIQTAAQEQNQLTAALGEIQLLRAALESRQRETAGLPSSPSEIQLRVFDQIRAARSMSQAWQHIGDTRKAQRWYIIAECFADAASKLAPEKGPDDVSLGRPQTH